MKKKMLLKVIALALMASLSLVAVCGCASAEAGEVEHAETAEEESEKETEEQSVKAYAEWTVKDITEFKEIVSGVANRQYAAGEGANHVIYEDISYDGEIVENVQFNTASVQFDTVGEYSMNYWVYFNLAALTGWVEENGMDAALDGLDSAADVLCVKVDATLLVTEGNPWTKDAEEEDAEEETASVSASAGSTTAAPSSGASTKSDSGSSKSNGGSSSKSNNGSSKSNSGSSSESTSSVSCDHNWVEQGYYEDVLVFGGYYECKVCGYQSYDKSGVEISEHEIIEHGGKASDKWVYPQYESVWHSTGYECSKCGATK